MVFIQVGVPDFGLRIWDIVYLTDEHRHSVHGYELRLQGTAEGWITGQDNGLLFCVSVEHRNNPCMLPSHRVIIEVSQRKATSVDLSNSRLCREWAECIDNDLLRELERKEEVGELLE